MSDYNKSLLDYINSTQFNVSPFAPIKGTVNLNRPSTSYGEYALKDAPNPKIVRFPSKNLLTLWGMGDTIVPHVSGTGNQPKGARAVDKARLYTNYMTWLDKVKTNPTDEDLKWMNEVSNTKRRNFVHKFFDRPDRISPLPPPSTENQKKMLPWVTNVNNQNTIRKTAAMNPVLAMMAKSKADQTGQMSMIDMARLNEMNTARRQRYSRMLQTATGGTNVSADIERNNIGTATSALLSILLGAGVGAGIGSVSGIENGAKAGALLGAGAGVITAGLGNAIGHMAGKMSKTPHKEALKEYSNIGLSRYLVPGASAYHNARMRNALIDTEDGVERPKQMVV